MSQSYSEDLRAYFTDVENLRNLFQAYLAAPELPKRILVIHGVGGIGKSSLLRMFRLHCKSVGVPVALSSGDEVKSAPAILGDWADDLKADDVTLATFAKTRQHYRALQAKAEDKAQESRKKIGDLAGKTAGKVAEAAAGAAVGAAIGSVVPGIGTIAGALGGMGAEALVDWLRGQGFAKPDIDLLLDPSKKLTDHFLTDIERVAPKRRLVLMLDTFEQLSALEDWARDLAERLHPNVLLVIAGRAMPNWSRAWSGWLAQAHVEELKPMTDDVMRELVRRYYAIIRGGEPDPKQVEAIISFARGLPMVVTSAVQLWVEYGVEDFEGIRAEVVADLVDRLKEGVPEEMTPVLEAAATVRWFNKDILRAVTGQADLNKAYDELRRFPFVRPRVGGLALHDAVREIMDEYVHVHDPERHRQLHERAAGYFEAQMAKRTGEEVERPELERLFHRVHANEKAGIGLFQAMAEELVRYRLLDRLSVLLNDANGYMLEEENSKLWCRYYTATTLRQNIIIKLAYYGRFTAVREFPRLRTEMARVYETWPRLDMEFKEAMGTLLIWMGQYKQAENDGELLLEEATTIQQSEFWRREMHIRSLKNLCFACGVQGKIDESAAYFQKLVHVLELCQSERGEYWTGVALGYYGEGLLEVGRFGDAQTALLSALETKRKVNDATGIPEIFLWLGEVHETESFRTRETIDQQLSLSESYYSETRRDSRGDRPYYACGALTGLVRVKRAQGDYTACSSLLAEAEQLAQQYEYNDHLASLRLTQGRVIWDCHIPEWGSGFDVALRYYQHTLIYALRYNRFLLDEALSGRPQGTPLRPIIPHCLERGEEGRRMLVALRDWWQTGINDIGTPRPDTISPIPEGIPLLEAERIAREREPADCSPQRTVLVQIDEALSR